MRRRYHPARLLRVAENGHDAHSCQLPLTKGNMHGRTYLTALILGAISSLTMAGGASASFDVDGNRQNTVSRPRAQLPLRETLTTNFIRLGGYGDQCTSYALDRMHESTGLWMAVPGNAYECGDEA